MTAALAPQSAALGSSELQPRIDTLNAGHALAFRLTASRTGTMATAELFVSWSNEARTVFVAVYSDAQGRPGRLLTTGTGVPSRARAWDAISIAPVGLVGGRIYWLALLPEGGNLRFRDRAPGLCSSGASAQTSLSAMPASWTPGSTGHPCPASVYLDEVGAPKVGSGIEPPVTEPPATEPPAVEPPSTEPPLEPPASLAPPAVTGTPEEGRTLGAGTGTWSNSPTSYSYQWQSCNGSGEGCSAISGATSSSRVLGASDVGHTLRVVVKATNAGGSAEATSAASAVVVATAPPAPANTSPPVVSGTTEEGRTLSASTGSWSNSPSSYSYQWQSCNGSGEGCSAISGATSSSRVLGASDVGHTLRVVVKATNAGGSAESTSAASAVVLAAPPPAPVNTSLPVVSGTPEEGRTLSAGTGSWSNSPTSYSYQWESCNASGEGCSAITGATSSSRLLANSDVGHTLRVVVKATNAGGSTEATSAASAVVLAAPPPAPVNLSLPVVSGTTEEGKTLSAGTGSWSNSPTSYSYQWDSCNAVGEGCSAITGATSSSRLLANSDVGHTLRVVVKATNAGGSAEATSAATAVVLAAPPPAPVNTSLPVVSGATEEGKTLSASTGSWSNSPTSYSYQWQSCNAVGGGCSAISGATSSSRLLATSDVGHTLRVVVKATNAGGSTEATSVASALVTTEKAETGPNHCFENPETEGSSRIEGCGFPGPKDTGVSNAECETLPLYTGALSFTGAIEGKRIALTVGSGYAQGALIPNGTASLKHDCIIVKAGQVGKEESSNYAPIVSAEGAHVTITETTVKAAPGYYWDKMQFREDSGATLKMSRDRIEGCDECVVMYAVTEVTESYVIANNEGWGNSNLFHREPFFSGAQPVLVKRSTIFEPEDQTAIIFAGTETPGQACATKVTFEEDLISGGDASFQVCGHSTLRGAGSYLKVRNNRFASCGARPLVKLKAGYGCKGPEGVDSHTAGDEFGFLAYGGSGPATPILGTELGRDEVVEFAGNRWDSNGAPVTQAEAEV